MAVQITGRRAPVVIDIPIVSSSSNQAFGASLQQVSDSTFNIGQQIQKQANTNYMLRTENEMRSRVGEIEREYQADPSELQKQLQEYRGVAFENAPNENVRKRMELQFEVLAQPSINRAFKTKQALIDNESETAALVNITTAQGQMVDLVPDMFGPHEDAALQASQKVQLNMSSISETLSLTKSDGSPMFTPEQRASKMMAARDGMFQQAAQAFMESSDDKLMALTAWKNNEVTIPFADEDGNVSRVSIRDAMPPETRAKADKHMSSLLKDQLSLENSLDTKADRDFKKQSDQTFSDLMVLNQNGQMTLQTVEANKNILTPEKYADARKIAISEDPVTQGGVYTNLMAQAAQGIDISEQVRSARFEQRQLSNADYEKLLNMAEDQGGAPVDPIKTGRNFVGTALGKLSSTLNDMQAITIAPAEREYEERINSFIQEKGRQPSYEDVRQIADSVVRQYSLDGGASMAIMVPTPCFFGNLKKAAVRAEQLPTSQDMAEVAKKTNDYFMAKHNGDKEAVKSDPAFRSEMRDIKRLSEIYSNIRGQ